jgi:hypothetical protein
MLKFRNIYIHTYIYSYSKDIYIYIYIYPLEDNLAEEEQNKILNEEGQDGRLEASTVLTEKSQVTNDEIHSTERENGH